MSVLYIQIRRNQITVRDLESKREVSGDAAFSNQRLLIANFFVAEKVLQDLVLQLHPRSTPAFFLPAKRMDIVVSALEMNEGGLSQVEERILHEVVAGATLMKYRQLTPSRKVRVFLLCGVYLPRWRCAYRGYGSSATCWSRGHQCRKVTDVNRSLLQPAAHTSNSITDTVAPDRPFQSALSP